MVLIDTKRFPGLLGLAPTDLRLRAWTGFDDDHMAIGTTDGERFQWPIEAVAATPYDARVMELNLDGSRLYFVADEPLRFADELADRLTDSSSDPIDLSPLKHESNPLDIRTTIRRIDTTPVPELRRSVDRDRLTPLGRKGKLRRPKRHAHLWDKADDTYGFARYICSICRHVTIVMTGPGAVTPMSRR